MKNTRVLNFGSINIDYVYKVDHFVQKGETISSSNLSIFSGGKGLNQSIALSRAGADVYHAGIVGIDGTFLIEQLKEAKVNTDYIYISDSIRTGNAIIQNDKKGDNCILLYGGANKSITSEMINKTLSYFKKDDWLVLQNEINEIPYIVEKAHEIGMKIVLNPSPMNDAIFDINLNYVDSFIMNEIEAQQLIQDKDNHQLERKLIEKYPNAEIIVTYGEKGSLYINKNKRIEQDAYRVDVVDTTAAGDTFTGYYLAQRIKNQDIKEALDTASKASAIAVSRKGASPSIPIQEEVANFE